MSSPSISVVVPTLNSAAYVADALASVAAAAAGLQVEVVVADGGSQDATIELVRKSGHVVIEGPDDGIYDGLNRGVARTNAPYLLFLNSDDLLCPGALDKLHAVAADDRGIDMVTGAAVIQDHAGNLVRRLRPEKKLTVEGVYFGVPVLNGRLFRRELLDRLGLFDTKLGLAADREFLARVARCGPRTARILDDVYIYRQVPGSQTLAPGPAARLRCFEADLSLAINQLGGDREPQLTRELALWSAAKLALERLRQGQITPALGVARKGLPAGWISASGVFSAVRRWRAWRGVCSGY